MRYETPIYEHPETGWKKLPSIYSVDGNEKVYALWELNLLPLGGELRHRYQIIIVWRESNGVGYKAQYIEDMGVAELYPSGPKSIQSAAFMDDKPADWVHTVDEVRDMAHELRVIDMEKILAPEHEDLVGGYHQRVEKYILNRNHVSVSGPFQKVERG